MKKYIYKLGEWFNVVSPLKGDDSKTRKGRNEIRKACILGIDLETNKFQVQMLTNQDYLDTNWILIRRNNEIVSGRQHYRQTIGEEDFLSKESKIYESNLTLEEVKVLIGIDQEEVWTSNGIYLGQKSDLELSTKTSKEKKLDTIYLALKESRVNNNC